ncbi:MHYT domain-containing protein [Paenibacillus sp. N3.4]|uniref:MHYT domain-containing protein n=1 Tax=Paenibacillus sp. N3.4 TaxID=2603222 RepID=UPI001650C75E|nr:MHYT domain-containing protein [Paenibacillus sp. N3.4]
MPYAVINEYHFHLILLSFFIILFASYTALSLSKKISISKGWYHKLWVFCCAIVMGVGIWSMHFIAMLAYPLPQSISFQFQTVLVSILLALIGSVVGYFITFLSHLKVAHLIIGGIFMGLAISGMHYTGLTAPTDMKISYLSIPFTLSIVIAIGVSITALYLCRYHYQRFMINSIFMGVAITSMHYIGMVATEITYCNLDYPNSPMYDVTMGPSLLAMYVAFGAVILFSISLISSLKHDRLHEEQIGLKASMMDSNPDCILLFNHRGWTIDLNPIAETTFGYSRKEALNRTLFDFLFPFDQDGQAAASMYRLLIRQDITLIGKRFETIAFRSDRTSFPAEMWITSKPFEGKFIFAAYIRDLSAAKNSEAPDKQPAYYDVLTARPTRNFTS